MAQKVKQRRDLGWSPWPKDPLHKRTISAFGSRIANLHNYHQKLRRLRPVMPIGARMVGSIGLSTLAGLPLPDVARTALGNRADDMWRGSIEDLQGFFFDRPWLFESTVHAISLAAGMGAWAARGLLGVLDATTLGDRKRRDALRDAIPSSGYRAFMAGYMIVATAVGAFRGGSVHVRKIVEDGTYLPVKPTPPFTRSKNTEGLWQTDSPIGGEIRHFGASTSLSACIADIDEMYWSPSAGMIVKIMKVGTGRERRWVVVVPGTDHFGLQTTANPADTESNVREMLGLRSAARMGVERAIVAAFDEAGIPPSRRKAEKILVVGHSQGGLTAHALAADPRSQIRVTHVLTVGSPSRSIPIRECVWSVSVEHVQDMIPWMDGVTESRIDDRVLLRRKLEKPKTGPLYYAHDTGTYLETVKLIEMDARRQITEAARGGHPLDHISREVLELLTMLPMPAEETHVTYYEIAQEVVDNPAERRNTKRRIRLVPDPDEFIADLTRQLSFDPYIPPDDTKNRPKDNDGADTSGGNQP